MAIEITKISETYEVRPLNDCDVQQVYNLCCKNELYYQYCPPFVTTESIKSDMAALPPGITQENKYYIGFFESDALVAVMDLILGLVEYTPWTIIQWLKPGPGDCPLVRRRGGKHVAYSKMGIRVGFKTWIGASVSYQGQRRNL